MAGPAGPGASPGRMFQKYEGATINESAHVRHVYTRREPLPQQQQQGTSARDHLLRTATVAAAAVLMTAAANKKPDTSVQAPPSSSSASTTWRTLAYHEAGLTL